MSEGTVKDSKAPNLLHPKRGDRIHFPKTGELVVIDVAGSASDPDRHYVLYTLQGLRSWLPLREWQEWLGKTRNRS